MTDLAALVPLAKSVLDACKAKGLKVATAESCTGGLVAALLTETAGSSAVVERGFVTYSNQAKTDMIGVAADLIQTKGAVSKEVARAMAEGALAHSRADIAVSITGVAGPDGGSKEKPVGLVHFAIATGNAGTRHIERRFGEKDRSAIRMAAARQALEMLQEAAGAARGVP